MANSGDGTVARIDPATRRITDTVHVKSSPTALALAQGSVWTAALASAARHRGGTLRLETRVYGLDPGAFDDPALLSLAYDGLVAYRRTGGSTFGTLVANLATDVPEPSPDGKTYVFKLRPNVRYSDGAPVRPEDFRASLEALLRLHGDEVPDYYHAIVGVPRCIKAPAKCDLSTGVETDARAGTITFHLTEPDPTFLHELAFTFAYVAPTNHPFGTKAAPPATGPYRVASFAPGRRVRLVRNPYFRVWSRDARPDGLPDEIVVRGGRKINAQVAAVQRGTADVVVLSGFFGGPLAPAAINALTTRLAGQMHTNAAPELDYMFLNVHTRPFDHVDVRRAINYAADRRAIAELAGGPNLAQPTCQILPPGFAGYTPFCPYTLQPSGTGTWNGPDLGRARRLIARSGTKGMRVTVWADEEKRPIARYFVSLLGRLGYRSSLRVYRELSLLPRDRRRLAHPRADRHRRVECGLHHARRLRCAVQVRVVLRALPLQPESRRVLRPPDRGQDRRGARRSRSRRQRDLARRLPTARRRGARRPTGQSPDGGARLSARGQLPVPPALGNAARPDLGSLANCATPRAARGAPINTGVQIPWAMVGIAFWHFAVLAPTASPAASSAHCWSRWAGGSSRSPAARPGDTVGQPARCRRGLWAIPARSPPSSPPSRRQRAVNPAHDATANAPTTGAIRRCPSSGITVGKRHL